MPTGAVRSRESVPKGAELSSQHERALNRLLFLICRLTFLSLKFIPMWLAPNVMTLIGFIGMIGATIYGLYCNPTFTKALPRECIATVFVLVFLYQTLDALDGKQARRTHNSTPLGQLFDHGCDAVSMCCFAMLGGLVTRTGVDSPFFQAFFFSSLIAFFLAQWEEYWTGIIDLGEVGVTEGQMLGLLLYVVAFIFGTDMFLGHAFTVMGRYVTVGDCVLSVFTFAFVSTIVTNVLRVNRATKAAKDELRAWLQLLPLFSLTVAFLVWIHFSPANIAVTHPIPLLVAAGIFYPACVERMVVCRLTKDEVPYIYPFTLPVFVGVIQALTIKNWHLDTYLIMINAVVAIASYVHFAVAVISQITNYFNIKAFAINRPLDWPLKTREKIHIDTPLPKKVQSRRGRSKSPKGSGSSSSNSSNGDLPSTTKAPKSVSSRTRSTSKKRQ